MTKTQRAYLEQLAAGAAPRLASANTRWSLERRGLIAYESDGTTRHVVITEAGRAALRVED